MKPTNDAWTVVPFIVPTRPKPTPELVAKRRENITRRAEQAARAGDLDLAHHAFSALNSAEKTRNPAIATAWLDEAEDALSPRY